MLIRHAVSRRTFLVGLAGFGLAPVLDPFDVFRFGQSVSVAIVGLGGKGSQVLGQALSLGIRVRALCDLKKDAAWTTLEERRIRDQEILVTDHLQQLLRAHPLDAVVLTIPPAQRPDIVRHALMARKHVLVPAPFANNKEEMAGLQALAAAQQSMIMHAPVCWNWDLKSIAQAVILPPGRIHQVECEYASRTPGDQSILRMLDAACLGQQSLGYRQPSWVCAYQFDKGLRQAVEIRFAGKHPGTLWVHESPFPPANDSDQVLRIRLKGELATTECVVASHPAQSDSLAGPNGLSAFVRKIDRQDIAEWDRETTEAIKTCELALSIEAPSHTGSSLSMIG